MGQTPFPFLMISFYFEMPVHPVAWPLVLYGMVGHGVEFAEGALPSTWAQIKNYFNGGN